MQQTANYNLNLPEGTDVVNPLVDYNPNFSTIDSAMKANADRTVGRATCIKSGTTHVVTRSNTGSNIINFTATGDWNAGDTMTIDSVVVSVFLPDGTAALDGAYLINTEVFGILNGTRFTLYSNVMDIPAPSASETTYNNANSGLAANNVQDAINEIVNPTVYLQNDYIDVYKVGKRVDVIMHPSATGTPASGTITTLPTPRGGRAMSSNCTYMLNGVMYDGILILDSTGNLQMMSQEGQLQGSRTFIRGMITYYTA